MFESINNKWVNRIMVGLVSIILAALVIGVYVANTAALEMPH